MDDDSNYSAESYERKQRKLASSKKEEAKTATDDVGTKLKKPNANKSTTSVVSKMSQQRADTVQSDAIELKKEASSASMKTLKTVKGNLMRHSRFMNEPLMSLKKLSMGILMRNNSGVQVGGTEEYEPHDPNRNRTLNAYAKMKNSEDGLKSHVSGANNILFNQSQASILMQDSIGASDIADSLLLNRLKPTSAQQVNGEVYIASRDGKRMDARKRSHVVGSGVIKNHLPNLNEDSVVMQDSRRLSSLPRIKGVNQ